MPANKTQPTSGSVKAFLASVADAARRRDCQTVLELMRDVTKTEPKMWGPSMVGFGSYHYKYESGREGDIFITGFSPRKQNLTLYIMDGFTKHAELLKKLGKHKTGKSCLYLKRLADVDQTELATIVREEVACAKRTGGRGQVPATDG